MKNRWMNWGLFVVVILVGVFFLLGQDTPEGLPQSTESVPSKTPKKSEKKVRKAMEFYAPGESELAPVEGESPSKIEEVYGLLDQDFQMRVRCRVPEGFGDGTYQHVPDEAVRYVWVEDGILTAFVHTHSAMVYLSDHLVTAGILHWERAKAGRWNTCSVLIPETVTVSGVVKTSGGTAASAFSLGTCEHGEFVTTADDGSFEFEAVKNRECYLTAAVETETSLGRGPSVLVDTSSDVSGVVVMLPSESDMWTGPKIEKVADQLAYMAIMQMSAEAKKTSPAATVLSNSDLTPEATAILEKWVADEQRKRDAMQAQAESVSSDSPFEERKQAVVDALFNSYY